jgi:DNA-binding response OmpR family regulator
LFVDDEPDMTTILKMALERAGFTIDAFNDPLLALESFKPNLYTLVILDVMMSKMNGIDLYNQIKKVDSGFKVCFLTASNEFYREKLMKERNCELQRDLFVEMPLQINRIVEDPEAITLYHGCYY